MGEWIGGEAVMAGTRHPRKDVFGAFARGRYRVEYRPPQDECGHTDVRVLLGGEQVAGGDFSVDGPVAWCGNVAVVEGHRRRGLASAMYVFAEALLWKPLIDYWADVGPEDWQSNDARALWVQPDRPFGHPLPRE